MLRPRRRPTNSHSGQCCCPRRAFLAPCQPRRSLLGQPSRPRRSLLGLNQPQQLVEAPEQLGPPKPSLLGPGQPCQQKRPLMDPEQPCRRKRPLLGPEQPCQPLRSLLGPSQPCKPQPLLPLPERPSLLGRPAPPRRPLLGPLNQPRQSLLNLVRAHQPQLSLLAPGQPCQPMRSRRTRSSTPAVARQAPSVSPGAWRLFSPTTPGVALLSQAKAPLPCSLRCIVRLVRGLLQTGRAVCGWKLRLSRGRSPLQGRHQSWGPPAPGREERTSAPSHLPHSHPHCAHCVVTWHASRRREHGYPQGLRLGVGVILQHLSVPLKCPRVLQCWSSMPRCTVQRVSVCARMYAVCGLQVCACPWRERVCLCVILGGVPAVGLALLGPRSIWPVCIPHAPH